MPFKLEDAGSSPARGFFCSFLACSRRAACFGAFLDEIVQIPAQENMVGSFLFTSNSTGTTTLFVIFLTCSYSSYRVLLILSHLYHLSTLQAYLNSSDKTTRTHLSHSHSLTYPPLILVLRSFSRFIMLPPPVIFRVYCSSPFILIPVPGYSNTLFIQNNSNKPHIHQQQNNHKNNSQVSLRLLSASPPPTTWLA